MTKIASAVTMIAARITLKSRVRIEFDHQLADAGEAEDRLDHHRAVEQRRRLVADDGDDRQHGVAQRVDEDDRAVADALGAGRLDVGRAEGLHHRAAHHLEDQAERPDEQHGDRQDPVPDRAGAGGRQPAEADGEDGDADDGDPEVGGRGADQRGEGDDPVEDAAGPEGGERADDDGGDRDQRSW